MNYILLKLFILFSIFISTSYAADVEKEPNNTMDGANPLSLDEAYSGEMSHSAGRKDFDYFSFYVNENIEKLIVKVQVQTPVNSAVSFSIYNNKREEIWRKTVGDYDTDIYGTPLGLKAGSYFFSVRMQSSRNINYRFELDSVDLNDNSLYEKEPNDSRSSAIPLIKNKSYYGHIHHWGTGQDWDYFSFTVNDNESLSLELQNKKENSRFAYYRIFNQLNNVVKDYHIQPYDTDKYSHPINQNQADSIQLNAGKYYLRVGTQNNEDLEYYISLKSNKNSTSIEWEDIANTIFDGFENVAPELFPSGKQTVSIGDFYHTRVYQETGNTLLLWGADEDSVDLWAYLKDYGGWQAPRPARDLYNSIK